MAKKSFLLFCMLFLMLFLVFAEEDNSSDDIQKEEKDTTWGFIFNTDSLLFDIESYQAGLGLKYLFNERSALRFLVDGYYSNSYNTFSFGLGMTYENHIIPGNKVSPYLGGFINGGIISQSTIIDESNRITDFTFPISIGAVLGVEYFILDFVSVFAEYNTVLGLDIQNTKTVTGEVATWSDPEYSSTIDIGIGNSSSIGIIIYLDKKYRLE